MSYDNLVCNLKVILIAIVSGLFSLLIFNNILIDYQTGMTKLKFGGYVNIIDSPVIYWFNMALSLFVACFLLWLCVTLFKLVKR